MIPTAQHDPHNEVFWSGWLNYCEPTAIFRPFKKSFAVLQTSALVVYPSKEAIKEGKCHVHDVSASSCVVDTQTELNTITTSFWVNKAIPNMFAVVSSRDTFIATTDTPNEMHCWVAVIRSAIQRKKKEKAIDDEKKRLAEAKIVKERERETALHKSEKNFDEDGEEMEQSFDVQQVRFSEQWKTWRDIRCERVERLKEGSIFCVYHKCYHRIQDETEEDAKTSDSTEQEQEQESFGQREETIAEKNDPNLVLPSLIKKKFFVCTKSSCDTQCFCSACRCNDVPPYDPTKLVQVRQLDESDIIIHKEIGSGSFSVVYRGEYHGRTVAVKRYISKVVSDPAKRNAIRREVGVLAASKGPLIVGLVGISASPTAISVVLEYIRFGSIQRHIDQQKMHPLLRMKCILDTARGMHFLHSRGILYRDLKPENLLIFSMDHRSDVCVKIADFGTGRKLPSKKNLEVTKHVGTPIYMAPEILLGADYSLPADVYSFGITSWEIWTLNYAFDEYDTEVRLTKAVCERSMRPILPESDIDDTLDSSVDDLPFALTIASKLSAETTSKSSSNLSSSVPHSAELPPGGSPLAEELSTNSHSSFENPSRSSFDIPLSSRASFQEEGLFDPLKHANKSLRPIVGKNKPWFVFPKDSEACDFPYPLAPLLANCWHISPNDRPPFWFVIEVLEEIFLELNRVYEVERERNERKTNN